MSLAPPCVSVKSLGIALLVGPCGLSGMRISSVSRAEDSESNYAAISRPKTSPMQTVGLRGPEKYRKEMALQRTRGRKRKRKKKKKRLYHRLFSLHRCSRSSLPLVQPRIISHITRAAFRRHYLRKLSSRPYHQPLVIGNSLIAKQRHNYHQLRLLAVSLRNLTETMATWIRLLLGKKNLHLLI